MLALATYIRNELYVGGAYLPQLGGLLQPGLYELSLTRPKGRPDWRCWKLVLKSTRLMADSYYNYFTSPYLTQTMIAAHSPTIPLCKSRLLTMFGIIPDVIYVTKLK